MILKSVDMFDKVKLSIATSDAYASRQKYEKASRRAVVDEVLALLMGQPVNLLPFDEVRHILKSHQQLNRGTQVIPLDRIVGSVGRYRDFTRAFLPLSGSNRERWMRIDAAMSRMETLPPIEVYKVGDVYFVGDGNHRVSVAHANDLTEIEAYVTEIPLPEGVVVTQEMDLTDLIRQVEYQKFLDQTHLDEIRPDADVYLTEPGRYLLLKEHIDVHRYFLGIERQAPIPYAEAVVSWYDHVYMPIMQRIREMDALREFPERTEADLYLWIADHREALRQQYGLPSPPQPNVAVADFVDGHSDLPVQRVIKTLRRTISLALGGGTEEIIALPTEEGALAAIDSANRESPVYGDAPLSDVQIPAEWGWMDMTEYTS
jgi:hypothetical protein